MTQSYLKRKEYRKSLDMTCGITDDKEFFIFDQDAQ
jgi:hypothetical protein